jgi:acylphosphatase
VTKTVIFQLIYTCALIENVSSKQLEKIARESRVRNQKLGLTGILLCNDGSVLQVLEGDREIVTDLYNRITEDPRVKNPLILIQRTALNREFPNWSMGFRQSNRTDIAFDLTQESLSDSFAANVSPELSTIGRTFARVNGLA